MKPSSITNCYLASRDGEPIIVGSDHGSVFLYLDGYAIVPLEEYESESNLQNVRRMVAEMKEARGK